jgi:hypothetical protein
MWGLLSPEIVAARHLENFTGTAAAGAQARAEAPFFTGITASFFGRSAKARIVP